MLSPFGPRHADRANHFANRSALRRQNSDPAQLRCDFLGLCFFRAIQRPSRPTSARTLLRRAHQRGIRQKWNERS
jgi:hypothetical protein